MDFEKYRLLEGKYWDVFLHEDQTALARLYFWYKEEATDLLEVPAEAMVEFLTLGNRLKNALNKLFQPDKYDYSSLNNVTKHLHVHMIPRYARKIELFGVSFEDTNFGHGYKRNKDLHFSENLRVKITNHIRAAL